MNQAGTGGAAVLTVVDEAVVRLEREASASSFSDDESLSDGADASDSDEAFDSADDDASQ